MVGDDDDSAGDDDDSASAPAQVVELEAGTIWLASGGDASLTGNVSSSALPYRIEGDGNIGFCGFPYAADIDGDGLGDLVCSDTRGDEIVALNPPGTPAVRVFAGTVTAIPQSRSYTDADLVFQLEELQIRDCPHNSVWIKQGWGMQALDEFGHKHILCSGIVVGSPRGFEAMAARLPRARPEFEHSNSSGNCGMTTESLRPKTSAEKGGCSRRNRLYGPLCAPCQSTPVTQPVH